MKRTISLTLRLCFLVAEVIDRIGFMVWLPQNHDFPPYNQIYIAFLNNINTILWGGGNGCHRINQMTVSTHPQKMKNTPAMNFQMTRRSQCVLSSGASLRFSLNAMRHICRPDSSRQGMQKSRLKNSSNGHSSSKMPVTVKILGSLTNAESISCINLDFLINGTYFLPPE